MTKKIFKTILAAAFIATAFRTSCDKQLPPEETVTPSITTEMTAEPISSSVPDTINVGLIYSGNGEAVLLQTEQSEDIQIEGFEVVVLKIEVTSETIYESVSELVRDGCKIIFAVDVEENDIIPIAEEFTDIKFEYYGGINQADLENLSLYYARIYQQQYICGMVAGYLTKNNYIGYISVNADDESIRRVNAFALGAKQANQNAEVHFIWMSDAMNAQNAVQSLLDKNCDVIFRRNIDKETFDLAAEKGVILIGNGYEVDNVLNITETYFIGYMTDKIMSITDGNYIAYDALSGWFGMESDMVKGDYYYNLLTEDQKRSIEEKCELMIQKQWDVFTGPIYNSYNTEILAEGEKLPDIDLRYMGWFVQNVNSLTPPAG